MADYEQEEKRLISDSLRHTEDKDQLRQQLSLKDGTLRDTESRLTSVQRELAEKQKEREQLHGELTRVQNQLSVEEQTKNEQRSFTHTHTHYAHMYTWTHKCIHTHTHTVDSGF